MTKKLSLTLAAMALAAAAPSAAAQDAAETAVILSGSAQTGAASKSLGGAVRNSVGGAANAVNATRGSNRRAGPAPRARASRGNASGGSIPAGVDPLAGTDAAAYRLDNGATIKVSGSFNPGATARCQQNCPEQAPD